MCLQRADYHGQVALDILGNNLHQPYVGGKCNRERIEEAVLLGIYARELKPMNQEDVDFICDLLDSLIVEYGEKT